MNDKHKTLMGARIIILGYGHLSVTSGLVISPQGISNCIFAGCHGYAGHYIPVVYETD